MNTRKMTQAAAFSLLLGAAVSVAGVVPVAAAAPSSSETAQIQAATAANPLSRQLLGQVSGPADFEASAQTAGVYAIEYEITGNAFFDTYVDNTELGYVGGSTGTYRTGSQSLSAGGHLVHVAGPEGSGTASVYLVQIS